MLVEFYGIKLMIEKDVYEPAEDTFLLLDVLRNLDCSDRDFLEIGCGSGLISIFMARKGCRVTATDISSRAVEVCRANAMTNGVDIRVYTSDLFSDVSGMFDYIAFNPPYLPMDDFDFLLDDAYRRAVVGGRRGNEVIIRFLSSFREYLKPEGKAFVVLSSLSNPDQVFDFMRRNNIRFVERARRSFFFEDIFVLEVRSETPSSSSHQ